MVVDDEPLMLKTMNMMLSTLYNLDLFLSSVEALDAFALDQNKYDLVITDFRMSDINGVELIKAILKIKDTTNVAIMTGMGNLYLPDNICVIPKPCTKKELVSLIESIIQKG